MDKWKAVYTEMCTYGLGASAQKPTAEIRQGAAYLAYELVTHPMTLEYHTKKMPWARILQEAVSLGYTSHQAGTCGLHVHVNRNAFGNTEEAQDAVIARILYFFEKHWEELLKFSRRTPRQLERWAARYG